jgi:hypothetical protein
MVDSDSPKCKGNTQVNKQTSKKKQHPDITNANLDAQLKQVSAFNANNSLLQAATIDKEGDTEEMSKKVTKYFTKPIIGNKPSVWWEGFEQFLPSKHLKLFSKYVMCLSCSKLGNNPESGIVKIDLSQSTSNLQAHKEYNHPTEYEAITNCSNLKNPQSTTRGELTTSIKNMTGFTTKLNNKCAKRIYCTAAATLSLRRAFPLVPLKSLCSTLYLLS